MIEGIDRTGKSTLAAELARQTGGQIIHASAPKGHPIDEYVVPLMSYDPCGSDTLILDRWHIGERVWPKYFKRKSQLDDPVFRWIEMFMQSRGALYVYAERRDTNNWLAELQAADEPVQTLDDLRAVQYLFEDAYAQQQVLWGLSFDLAHGLATETADILSCAARAQGEVKDAQQVTSHFVGCATPDILLVGDIAAIEDEKQCELKTHGPDVPFGPYAGTSGRFLMESFCAGRLYTGYIAITNARMSDGQLAKLEDLWFAMGCPFIIALGKKAELAIQNSRLGKTRDRGSAPHPQYARRFLKDGPAGYWRLLSEAELGFSLIPCT